MAAPTPGFNATGALKLRRQTLRLHNRVRAQFGANKLRRNNRLEQRAQRYANLMLKKGRFAHSGNGNGPALGVPPRLWFGNNEPEKAGENIARGQRSARRAVVDWRNSCSHFYNMINNYQKVGIGVARSGRDRYATWYWCVHLSGLGNRFSIPNACAWNGFKYVFYSNDPRKP